MKILHIIAGMPPESGVAAVVARLAVEQRGLGLEVAVAWTEGREVLKFEPASLRATPSQGNAKVLKLVEKLETGNLKLEETLRSEADHKFLNIEHRTGEGEVREVMFRRSWPRAMYFSWSMLFGLSKEMKDADVVHVHGCWTFPVWWGACLALRQKKTLVMSPHGSFNPLQLKHSAWKKKLVGWMDRWLLKRASVIVATCEAENAWIEEVLKLESSKVLKLGENIQYPTRNDQYPRRRNAGIGERSFEASRAGARSGIPRWSGNAGEPPRQGEAAPRRPKIVVIPNGVERETWQ